MKSEIKQKMLKFDTYRRIVQFLSFIFLSAIIFNLGSLPLLLPVLWTWGIEPNTVGDAFTALQFTLYNVAFPWLAIASFLTIGILVGKSFCGWICPFGFIQDLISLIKRKKMEFSPRTHNSMIYVKYAVLSITLFISVSFSFSELVGMGSGYERALSIFAEAPFTTLSPAETLFSALPRMILGFRNATLEIPYIEAIFWVQMAIMVGVLVFSALVPRGWCKYLCPHGAIMALMNRFSFLGLRRDLVKCAKGECRLCVEACPMNVRILALSWEKISDPECIYCMKCVDVCPNKAIKLKYP